MMALLEMKQLKKTFSASRSPWGSACQPVKAVDGVDLAIEQGQSLGLVGESGCGKTTLARIAIKIIKQDSGNVFFEGQDLARLSRHQARFLPQAMQMVFQDPFSSLDPRFSVSQILKEPMAFSSLSQGAARHKMQELLSAVGLPGDILERFPHEFSGGERQRLAIARALAVRPKLLILDEAVSSLDVLVQEQILDLLEALKAQFQLTYFFISHNLRIVKRLCPKIAVMYQGKIVEMGPSEELLFNPLHPYTQRLISAAINYRTYDTPLYFNMTKEMTLREKQNQHFVLE